MSQAFVDTSVVLSLMFRERSSAAVSRRLAAFSTAWASELLEAEFRSACQRERVAVDTRLITELTFALPDRSLSPEITRVLDAGYVRGADCWHLATALYLAPDPAELTFVTLDLRQRAVAESLGFQV